MKIGQMWICFKIRGTYGTANASFQHATIEYSGYGIRSDNLESNDSLTVTDSTVRNNGSGIQSKSSGSNSTVSVTNSLIADNLGYGIGGNDWSRDHWTITGNTITGNSSAAIHLEGSYSATVSDNVIADNGGHGVYFYYLYYDFVFSGNTVSNNAEYGLYYSNGDNSPASWATDSITVTNTGGYPDLFCFLNAKRL